MTASGGAPARRRAAASISTDCEVIAGSIAEDCGVVWKGVREGTMSNASLYPLFLKLAGRKVLVVGGGPIATGKVGALLDAGADVHLVAPDITPELAALEKEGKISVARRSYESRDLEGAWLAVVAAPIEVARLVAEAAESQRLF